ncbi:MAG: DNA gyrase inhibitor YacG [Burkholderiaceae bacterium]|nr:DNA gyrase inhibitor YacG [Burkholderiaceae bacterium]
MNVFCPTCGAKVTWSRESKFRPFCSERCKMIDLGGWASDGYSIGDSEPNDVDISADSSKLTH